jgi:hypothetical protein
METIKWSGFGLYNVEDSDLDTAPDKTFPFIEGSRYRAVNTGINEPSTQINFEDFYPGPISSGRSATMRCTTSPRGVPR